MPSPRRRGSMKHVIPSKEGIYETCHPLEGGDPGNIILLDSRLRGNDKKGSGNDNYGVIPSKEGIYETCHPRENGDPLLMSSPRRRGSRKYNASGFPPPRE
ncbi:MAG: hypothetical protein SFT93_04080 [Rickettsiaceae bacterium]|nr:hypothetical protein [Rickettsiaceae bacterium]